VSIDILSWFDRHKRDLPWRHTTDPYAIWVSEIMLQQTQVVTVIPYWQRWMQRFPTVESLAQSEDEELLAMWQGLGYYRRCRLLKQGAQYVLANGMPETVAGWLAVPGVGRYTAGAINSIAQGKIAPLVDGNVARVYSRWFGDGAEYDQLLKNAWRWAEGHVHTQRPGDWNQALMEIGATICTPTKPQCSFCPIQSGCVANLTQRTATLPTPKPRPAVIEREETLVVAVWEGCVALIKRNPGEWWEDMWTLPRFDSLDEAEAAFAGTWLESFPGFKYVVTHHRIYANVAIARLDHAVANYEFKPLTELSQLPIPAPHRKALKKMDLRVIS
jgi:A/G-specific adenine glycosylase